MDLFHTFKDQIFVPNSDTTVRRMFGSVFTTPLETE